MGIAGAGESAEREKLIREIRSIQNELVFLKVKRELFSLSKMSTDNLRELAGALRDQLKTRKRFLGVK